jgi:integrase
VVTLENAQISPIWAFLFLAASIAPNTRQISIAKKHLWSVSPKGKYPYKEARLVDGDGDISKRWVVEYYIWSEQQEKLVRKRIRISDATTEKRYETAKQAIKEVNAALKSGYVVDPINLPTVVKSKEHADLSADISISKALDYFLDLKQTTMKKQAFKTYRSCGNILREYLTQKKIKHLKLNRYDSTQAFAYLDYLKKELKHSNRTYNKHRGFCSTLFIFFRKRKLVPLNPFEETDKLKTKSGKHIPYRPEQIAEVKQYFKDKPDDQFWLFLNCIYYLFARPHEELRYMRVKDILSKTVRIDPDNAKGSNIGHRLIPPTLEALFVKHDLRSYPPNFYVFTKKGEPGMEPVGESYFYDRSKKMLDYLGFGPGYDLYGWKHTGVIALYLATKDMKLIQRQCGHTTIDQTDQYLSNLGLFLDYDQLSVFPAL